MTVYCLDSSALINPWNKHYSMDLAPGYWNGIAGMAKAGTVVISVEVRNEIFAQRDALALQRVGGRLELVPPKSLASRRVVALPAFVVDALHAQRLRRRRDRLLAGSRWRADDRDLVFTTTIGTPMDGIAVTRRFQSILREAGLPHQRFHDLRHACASLLLAQGVAPRVVMETLGHSQISLTLNTYTHVIPALGRGGGRDGRVAGELIPQASAQGSGSAPMEPTPTRVDHPRA